MKKIILGGITLLTVVSLFACSNKQKYSNENDNKKREFVSSDYETNLSVRDFTRNPEENKGKKDTFVAKIIQKINMEGESGKFYLATVTPSPNEKMTIMLFIDDTDLHENILENDEVRVWVTFVNNTTYNAIGGVSKEVPAFHIDFYKIIK